MEMSKISNDDRIWADYTLGKDNTNASSKVSREPNDRLGKDAFLQLLIAQMKYQDPLNPMDDKEFISQMAQFSSLEQMNNLNSTMSNAQSFDLIGKKVDAVIYNEQTGVSREVSGLVESVEVVSGKAILRVDGHDVNLDDVVKVHPGDQLGSIWNSIMSGISSSQSMSLIDKTIQAIISDSEGNIKGFVEGKVEFVKLINGIPILVVGDDEIFLSEVISVSDKNRLLGESVTAIFTDPDTGKEIEVSGVVEGVEINNNKAYLKVDDKLVPIDKIDLASEGLRKVGETITYKQTTGVVDNVLVRNGKVFFLVQTSDDIVEVSVEDYLKGK